MPPRPPQQHSHESEVVCQRAEPEPGGLCFHFVQLTAQRTHLGIIGVVRGHHFNDSCGLLQPRWYQFKPLQLRLLPGTEFRRHEPLLMHDETTCGGLRNRFRVRPTDSLFVPHER